MILSRKNEGGSGEETRDNHEKSASEAESCRGGGDFSLINRGSLPSKREQTERCRRGVIGDEKL